MQIAAKEYLWGQLRPWTEVVLRMTNETGLYVRFLSNACDAVSEASVDWGDGTDIVTYSGMADTELEHTYAEFGQYILKFRNMGRIGFRRLDGHLAQPYDDAIISIVDYGGKMYGMHSGGFRWARNLERVIAPACIGVGQRAFADCDVLREVELGECEIHYDGSFENCPLLTTFRTKSTGTCWLYVWKGCTSLEEIDLGAVKQFEYGDFQGTTKLMDITIGDKTVDQLLGQAESGNILTPYNSPFPWGAQDTCRFHCLDGIVLGNGTRIQLN